MERRQGLRAGAHLAGEMGVLAFKLGFARWSEAGEAGADELTSHNLAALRELQAAGAALTPASPETD